MYQQYGCQVQRIPILSISYEKININCELGRQSPLCSDYTDLFYKQIRTLYNHWRIEGGPSHPPPLKLVKV